MENGFLESASFGDITVISGVRPMGRTIDVTESGRRNDGFLYIFSGRAWFCDENGNEITASDGELLYLPFGKKYKMQYTARETTFVVVNFKAADISGNRLSLCSDIEKLCRDDSLRRIAEIMMKLELCGSSQKISAALRKKELLYRLLGFIALSLEDKRTDGAEYSQIAEGVRLLEGAYLENIPITDMALASSVSVNTFRSLFKKQYGTSPVKYRNKLRIERARDLLSEGGFTVLEVAYACGFENIGYFCRCYKALVGESPSDTKRKFVRV